MTTYEHLWQDLAELFLEWELFLIKFVEKIETHVLFSFISPENLVVF
jgi:hypothetical protein